MCTDSTVQKQLYNPIVIKFASNAYWFYDHLFSRFFLVFKVYFQEF